MAAKTLDYKMLIAAILLSLALLGLTMLFNRSPPCCDFPAVMRGFPIVFFQIGQGKSSVPGTMISPQVFYDKLVLDYLFWLAVSYGLIYLINKITVARK